MSDTKIIAGQSSDQAAAQEERVFCQHQQDQIVVQFRGILHLCRTHAKEIHNYLKQHVRGDKNVVFDLDGIVNVDAQGLALLIHLNKKLREKSRSLSLINLSSSLRRILSITSIDRLIPIRADLDKEALELASSEARWQKDYETGPKVLSEKKYK